jgi:4-hydroxybenzoate polyprenyltransferase
MRGGLSTASRRIRVFLDIVKFEHTIFALPFAYIGMILAAGGLPSFRVFFWITLAMVGARTTAMAANRVIDREIDSKNPRTSTRALPKKLVKPHEVWLLVIISLVLLTVSAWMLNPLCLELLPLAAITLVGYSYTKYHSWGCHFVLGLADGAAPVGAWAAVTGTLSIESAILWIAVGTWIAAFDIIYACQDIEFDRANGIKSIPARFGVGTALTVSAIMHVVTVVSLIALAFVMPLGPIYWVALAVSTALLVYEHAIVRPHDLSRLNVAFFNVNGYISVILFAAVLAAVYIH